jgi:hypothetical protein
MLIRNRRFPEGQEAEGPAHQPFAVANVAYHLLDFPVTSSRCLRRRCNTTPTFLFPQLSPLRILDWPLHTCLVLSCCRLDVFALRFWSCLAFSNPGLKLRASRYTLFSMKVKSTIYWYHAPPLADPGSQSKPSPRLASVSERKPQLYKHLRPPAPSRSSHSPLPPPSE